MERLGMNKAKKPEIPWIQLHLHDCRFKRTHNGPNQPLLVDGPTEEGIREKLCLPLSLFINDTMTAHVKQRVLVCVSWERHKRFALSLVLQELVARS